MLVRKMKEIYSLIILNKFYPTNPVIIFSPQLFTFLENFNILSERAIEYLFFDLLLKVDYKFYNYSVF